MSAKTNWLWRTFSLVMALVMAFGPLLTVTASAPSQDPQPPQPDQPAQFSIRRSPETKTKQSTSQPTVSREQALAKMEPALRKLATSSAPSLPSGEATTATNPLVMVRVVAQPGTDFSKLMSQVIPMRVILPEQQDFYGQLPATQLVKLASMPEVIALIQVVMEKNGPEPVPPEERGPQPSAADWAVLRANAESMRAGLKPWSEAKAIGDGYMGQSGRLAPEDWFEISPAGPHKAEVAWQRGFTGKGVVVEVNDDGVDWAHPDLMGKQTIYSTTITGGQDVCGPLGCAAAYNGWPMAYNPLGMYQYVLDSVIGTHYIANGQPGNHYADTSETPALSPAMPGVMKFTYTPLIDYATLGFTHTYLISSTMSKSGVVHVGTHPDESLRDYVWGEKVAVLVTDPNIAGVYDTVYVDLDDNYDFRDEKPMTRADPTDPSTKNNPIGYRDMTDDGKADLSAGALYFIADGVTPIPASWVMYFDWAAPAPANGSLVAFDGPWASGYSHGTQCSSNVVGQGQTDFLLPRFRNLPGNGVPAGATYGANKGGSVVDVSNIYYDFSNSKLDAYTFAVFGYDGQPSTLPSGIVNPDDTDGLQITSNSYGQSYEDNDGWDYDGRYVSRMIRRYGRYISHLDSTGNGAPAYGTVTPPNSDVSISVGASTQYGSTGWDSITDTEQINYNDVAWYSNRGPSARGTNGVDILAGGQRAAGAEALNYYSISTWGEPNGNMSWSTWGGTSRSSPAAAGNMALLYEAFRAKYGRWPWYDEAKAIVKSSSTDLNYDVMTQGSGSINSDRGTSVAAGWYGLYVTPDEWNPGDYRGVDYPAFAHIMTPTQNAATAFQIHNTGIATITADIMSGNPELIATKEFTFTVTPSMTAAFSPDNFFKAPQIIIPITATEEKIEANSWWGNIEIPKDAQLMRVTMRLPYSQFDPNEDYNADNRWRIAIYNWTDINGNGKVWDDKNSNGVVNFVTGSAITQIDGGRELVWSDPTNELDRWEYERFDYARPGSTVYQLPVHDPLSRMKDGLFIGLQQYAGGLPRTDMTFRVEFFKYSDGVNWLTLSEASIQVGPGETKAFTVTASADGLMPGIYEAAVKVYDPGATVSGIVPVPGGTKKLTNQVFPAHTSVVPVAMVVAPEYSDGMTFGGVAQATDPVQAKSMYNNALVQGYFDWTWRAESGDWRFFFFDNPTIPADGTRLIVKETWNDAAPHTDIDTIIMGPTLDAFSPGGRYGDPDHFGPYTLSTVGSSPNTNIHDGVWRFDTSSGANEDWVTAPFTGGLHVLAEHNILFEGDKFDVVFTKTVGTIRAKPSEIHIQTYKNSGSEKVVVQSSLLLPGMQADAYGLGGPEYYTWNVPYSSPGDIEFTFPITITHAAKLSVETSSPDISDIDIFLFYWNGVKWTQIASSAGGTADEYIEVLRPADGHYLLGIDNYSGPAGTVNAAIVAVQGSDLSVSGTTTQDITPNHPVTLTVNYNRPMVGGETYEGLLLLGPSKAPGAVEIPVVIERLTESAMVEKKVNFENAFAGSELTYSIDLYNMHDLNGMFSFIDAIPENTSFVTVTGQTESFEAKETEEFEGAWPPAGWEVKVNSGDGWNTNTFWGADNLTGGTGQSADADADAFGTALDSELWSKPYTLTGVTKPVIHFKSNYQHVDGDNGWFDITTDNGANWTTLLHLEADEPANGTTHEFDLSAYKGQTVRFRWWYQATDWDWYWQIDDVILGDMIPHPVTYDPVKNQIKYFGSLPLGAVQPAPSEGFEAGGLPTGWTTYHDGTSDRVWQLVNATDNPELVYKGNYSAWLNYPDSGEWDEWLVSKPFTVTVDDPTLAFWAGSSTEKNGYDWDVRVDLVDVNGVFIKELWSMMDEDWPDFQYRLVEVDLSDYIGKSIYVAWHGVGDPYWSFGLDDIHFPGDGTDYFPSLTVTLKATITDTVSGGEAITNTAELTGYHLMGGKYVSEATKKSSAVTKIGVSDFSQSFKEAPASISPGGVLTYTIHVLNSGGKTVWVDWVDTLPVSTTFESLVPQPNAMEPYIYDEDTDTVSWSGNVNGGEERVFTFYATADAKLPFGHVITNTATIMWEEDAMELVATTKLVPSNYLFIPMTSNNYQPPAP